MTVFLLAIRLIFALAGVLALMWVAAKVLSRSALGGTAGGGVQVLSRTSLNRAASVSLVQVGDEILLLGVTEQQVNVLRSRPAAEMADVVPAPRERSAVRIPLQTGSLGTVVAGRGLTLIEHLRARTERR